MIAGHRAPDHLAQKLDVHRAGKVAVDRLGLSRNSCKYAARKVERLAPLLRTVEARALFLFVNERNFRSRNAPEFAADPQPVDGYTRTMRTPRQDPQAVCQLQGKQL